LIRDTAGTHEAGLVGCSPYRPAWVERLTLTNFRSYSALTLEVSSAPVVLVGANGTGKTNLLEALSLLAPGAGLRGAAYPELARVGGYGDWAVAARVHCAEEVRNIGTGQLAADAASPARGRVVRIDGVPQSGSGALTDYLDVVWLTPAMDGLFTGPASDRRAFLDRLTLCFDPGYRMLASQFDRAMRQRNRLLQEEGVDDARLRGLELVMAETGVAVAAARAQALASLSATIAARRVRDPLSPFPWSKLRLQGSIDELLAERPAVEVEDSYLSELVASRARDRLARRTLLGPHRSDLIVEHGPKAMPAQFCSTGEQKALLIGLVLAHAELLAQRRRATAPVLLLDEVAAHLDAARRGALFAEILRLGAQAWLTGTDADAFAALAGHATLLAVAEGGVSAVRAAP
jgi:DNA replication and repair protein RecF